MINFLKNIYHYFLAWLGNILYAFPSNKIFILGITGTKGKSTTLELINAILEAAGYKTAFLSSLSFKIDKEIKKNTTSMTMPGRFFISRFLRKAVNRGCQYALIEVSSQGILQHRHRFINWDAALITHLKPEHIEAHGSFENYRQSKADFFSYVAHCSRKPQKFFFINEKDPSREYFTIAVNGCGEIKYFNRENFIKNELSKNEKNIGDWLSHYFNLENSAAATTFAYSQGINWSIIREVFKNFKGIPGRLEIIQEEPFRVVIDYAHTTDSLQKVYETLHVNSNLICVLGAAGGGRDKWKRPVMGKIAAEYCREIILTNEDPYNEDPVKIIREIKSGVTETGFKNLYLYEILERRKAIKKALSLAKKNDTVIITGKGSESWIHIAKGRKIHWDEGSIVEQLLKDGL